MGDEFQWVRTTQLIKTWLCSGEAQDLRPECMRPATRDLVQVSLFTSLSCVAHLESYGTEQKQNKKKKKLVTTKLAIRCRLCLRYIYFT